MLSATHAVTPPGVEDVSRASDVDGMEVGEFLARAAEEGGNGAIHCSPIGGGGRPVVNIFLKLCKQDTPGSSRVRS